ncbi:MAG: uroporphyrinogen-III C-methyltransferase [Candidatus Hydrogenedentes bacterium]|nr:uroporphyrinogen-III C-methyltransferase [Candidatus Hydrogenedentota bacterium]
MTAYGKIFLVGAGPGDPGLLTLRGQACLQRADVVIYDALVNPELLKHAPKAEHVFVGKKSERHSLPQEDINRILMDHARRHGMVVRLKGGDPFVFGRGGEEALALAAAGIPYEVVPGITAGIAGPAYAGIPVTHRAVSSSVTLITGHLRKDAEDLQANLGRIAQEGTLCFYMGVNTLPRIVQDLLDLGRPPETPCAVIEWATHARQRAIHATLATLADTVAAEHVEAPAIVVVGDVCALGDSLAWFEARPLHGLRIVVTHAEQRQGPLEQLLLERGAEVFSLPTLAVTPMADPAPEEFSNYDWIVLTTANAVEMLFQMLDARNQDLRALAQCRICAVGATTLDALHHRFAHVDAVPENYRSEAILAAIEAQGGATGKRIWLPRADIARSNLPAVLREAGANVTERIAYTTHAPAASEDRLEELLHFDPHCVVFTNAGAARHFCQMLGNSAAKPLPWWTAASIGPVTTSALEAEGYRAAIEPAEHTIHGLAGAITAWWAARAGGKET